MKKQLLHNCQVFLHENSFKFISNVMPAAAKDGWENMILHIIWIECDLQVILFVLLGPVSLK